MNRKEFLSQLEQALQGMPAEECRRAVEYYENYFDEAGPENEQEVLQQLGAPEKVAADILRDYRDLAQRPNNPHEGNSKETSGQKNNSSMGDWFRSLDNGQKLLLLILLLVAACVIAPVGVGVIGGIGGILIALICVVCTVFFLVPALDLVAWAGMLALMFAAGAAVSTNPMIALLLFGLALICAACGVLLGQLTKYLFCAVFPGMIRGMVQFIRRILHLS
ncbi:DUF1700 domain-containing protein [Butyricicoccus sp.]|uniref:DUF1700 domain-containing protein n=1 Tax=Butyricicoccus sp. TaxID=2049021 RepID=UPI003F1898EA